MGHVRLVWCGVDRQKLVNTANMLDNNCSTEAVRRRGQGAFATVLVLLGLGLQTQAADIKTGLKAYWNFDTKSAKDSVGIYDGTETGSAPVAYVAGKGGFGQALVLDGTDQYVEITGGEPDDMAFTGGSMSIAGWFKVGTFDKQWQALVAKGEGTSWRVARRGGETGMAQAGGVGEGPAGGAVDDGQWHQFVAISDVDAVNFGTALYIDGVQYTMNASAPALAANGKRMMIGGNPDSAGRNWSGEIDDVAVWDRVLTEAEVTLLYNKGAGTPLSSLLGSGPADTDKDGMPDDWENQYGLNPNDASDAAKDANGNGISNLDEYKLGLNPRDVAKPTILSTKVTASFDTVIVTFSKPLDAATATNVANYTITPALAVSAASLSKGSVVTLTTAKQTPGATAYTLKVSNVKDVNGWTIAANSASSFYSYILTKSGMLKFSYWGNISGAAPVDNLYSDPRYPATPDLVLGTFSFNSRDAFPDDSHENYGATIEGYITPAEAGDYRFFLYSDDSSQFFLSTDDKEANLQQVAEETGCCNNFTEPDSPRTSEPIALKAGTKYFARLAYKEGGGGDYGQVAWRKSTDTTPAGSLKPIAGKYLSSAVDLPAPAEGLFLTQTPAPNATKVSPVTSVTIVHADGKTPWASTNVTLKIDGNIVAHTFTKDGTLATIVYTPSSLLASKTKHIVSLGYSDPGAKAATLDWTFETSAYSGPVKDAVKGYNALVLGSAVQTADKGGASGTVGDIAVDLTSKGGPLQVVDAGFLAAVNAATAANELSVSLWIKKYDIADSSAFWFSSPSQSRVFQAHTPWSNANIYFDTAGCCDGATQRINAGIDTFPGYSGDVTWWNNWRSYVFTKKADHKQVWVDGQLFLEGDNTGALSSDINQFMIGSDNAGGGLMHGLVDDVAVYSKALVAADIAALKAGTKPTALPASAGLIADWDFNTAPAGNAGLAVGLVSAWSFDGNLNDGVGVHNGTAKGTRPVSYVAGRDGFGQAIKLNGIVGGVTNTDQYIDITGGNPADLDFAKGSVSIAGWFKVGGFDHDWQALISKGEGSSYRIARRGSAGTIAYAGGVGEGADDVPAVNDGAWHQFVAVTDASGKSFGTALYLDGVLHSVNTNAAVLASNPTKHLFIGENPDSTGRQWNGEIDDVGIWNRVLSATEVAALWNSGAGLALSTLPKAPAPLTATVARSGSNITIQWTPAGGTLESSASLGAGAAWTTVGTANPATVAIGAGNLYYRVRQ